MIPTEVEMGKKVFPIEIDVQHNKKEYHIFVCSFCDATLGKRTFSSCERCGEMMCFDCSSRCTKSSNCRIAWCKNHIGAGCVNCGKDMHQCEDCSYDQKMCHECEDYES